MTSSATLPSEKPEFSPLLAVGFKELTIDELRAICVDQFPGSTTRSVLADKLAKVIEQIEAAGIDCELWVDGSFLTEKLNPNDVDFIVRLRCDVADNADHAQLKVLRALAQNQDVNGCDSYVHIEYPENHPQHQFGEWMHAYWIRQWGFSREGELKGIALIKIGRAMG